MRVSVVFGTRGDDYAIPHLQRIFHCLAQQTFQDFKVIVVVDRKFRDEEDYQGFWATLDCHALQYFTRDDRVAVFTQRNADFIPHSK
jgi:sulfur carrier protein ThiS